MRDKAFWAALAALTLAFSAITVKVWPQTAGNVGTTVSSWVYTGFPLYGVVVTPADGTALAFPMSVRANTAGTVSATCVGNGLAGTSLSVALAAGEFFPCQVIEVNSTGTDAITIHGFY